MTGRAMTDGDLFETLGELRGEQVVLRPKASEIPCYETSDQTRLCANPVVTVVMLAYNQAPYVEKALDSVLGQKTDFEYEILLCEDCSTDGTREICFEAQRRHPDKVRLLWYDVNVNKLGGNSRRANGRCRGEFIAYCECDDYWSDPLKLSKQLALMRRHPSASLCLGGTDYLYESTGRIERFRPESSPPELLPGMSVCRRVLLGSALSAGFYKHSRHTSTQFVRRSVLESAQSDLSDFFRWNLRFGDTRVLAALSSMGDVCFLAEPVSVYRINETGVTQRDGSRLMRDADVFGIGFSCRVLGLDMETAIGIFADKLVWHWVQSAKRLDRDGIRAVADRVSSSSLIARLFARSHCRLLLAAMRRGRLHGLAFAVARAVYVAGSSMNKRRNRRKYIDERIR